MAEAFGRYQLLKRLSAGGMGEVFLARQGGIQGFEKVLVIKTLLKNLTEDQSFIDMFLDEARLAARITHPNVVQLFDLGEVEGIYYIAMEYIHGEDMRKVWKQAYQANTSFPVHLSARIVADAAAGLGYAHRLTDADGKPIGLVHRDVSPQNVLVTFDGGVKVIDFGVAKAAGRITKTESGALKGKYSYMSPEQVTGEDLDERSDIFALGIVFWETLTGSRLFKRESDVKTMRAVADCDVPPPSVQSPNVPESLDAIVLKALARDRDDRYQTMEELRIDIEEWLTESHSQGSAAHLAKFMRMLFKERLDREGSKGPMFDVDPNETGFSPLGNEPRPASDKGSGSSLKSLAGAVPDIRVGETPSKPAGGGSKSRAGVAVAVGILLAGAVGAGVYVKRIGRPAVTPAAAVEENPVAPPPAPLLPPHTPEVAGAGATAIGQPPAPPQPLPSIVTVQVDSEPPGAKLLDGSAVMGITPATLMLPRARGAVNMIVQRAGYKPMTQGIDLSSAPGDKPLSFRFQLEADATQKPENRQGKTHRPHSEAAPDDDVKTFE
jgi:serine/threonine protein kinase